MSIENLNAKPGQYLTFVLNKQFFAVPIGAVKEINQIGEITPVPQTPHFVAGVINLRGKVIPVVDLRLKLGQKAQPFNRETCVIVVENSLGQTGMIVDSVMDVVTLNESQLEPPPLVYQGENKTITGVAKIETRVLILLNLDEIIAQNGVLQLQETVA